MLRDGVLDDVTVAVAGDGPLGSAAGARCAALGAREGAAAHVLVWDGDGAFDASAEPGIGAVHAALDAAWDAVRPAATEAMIPGDRGGKVVLLAPRPGDAHREAARAGLENLARTLGIEWARFGIRTVAILPGARTDPVDIADLVAYLASPAGDYFSGCALTLGAVDPPAG